MKFKPIKLQVYLQDSDRVRMLEALLEDSKHNEQMWRERYKALEMKYANVQIVNIELIDELRAHGIRFRPSADYRTWEK